MKKREYSVRRSHQPLHVGYTSYHLISEVKQNRARTVFEWANRSRTLGVAGMGWDFDAPKRLVDSVCPLGEICSESLHLRKSVSKHYSKNREEQTNQLGLGPRSGERSRQAHAYNKHTEFLGWDFIEFKCCKNLECFKGFKRSELFH